MIIHYLKHAYKFILSDKFHSFLNIVGLSIGITISIITLLYVQKEFNYNANHEKADRIYVYGVQRTIGGKTSSGRGVNRAVGPVLKQHLPGIESFARLQNTGVNLIRVNEKLFYETDFVFADSSMFNVFTTEFYSGQQESCLREPKTVVLTKDLALKYYNLA